MNTYISSRVLNKNGSVNASKMLNVFLVTLVFIVYGLTGSEYAVSENSIYKYIVLLGALCVAFVTCFFKKENVSSIFKRTFIFDQRGNFLALGLITVTYSFAISLVNMRFTFRTIFELFLMFAPIIYAYMLVEVLSFKTLDKTIVINFFITFLIYLLTREMSFLQIITSLFKTNYFESYSPLESSVFSGLATSFAFYFIFFKNRIVLKVLSVLFVFMTFKRLSIVFVVLLILFSFFRKTINKSIAKKSVVTRSVIIFLFLCFYYLFVHPVNRNWIEDTFNVNISSLTMTRSDRFSMLYSSNYISYGFGSSTEYMYEHFNNVALEMDLIKIIIELGFLPAAFLIYVYLSFGRKKIYCFLIMMYHVLNLIFASSLVSCFSWLLTYIIVLMIGNVKIQYRREL